MSKAYIGTSKFVSDIWESAGVLIPPYTLCDDEHLAFLYAQQIAKGGNSKYMNEIRVFDKMLVQAQRELIRLKLKQSILRWNPMFVRDLYNQSDLGRFLSEEKLFQPVDLIEKTDHVPGKPIILEINLESCVEVTRAGIAGFFGIHIEDNRTFTKFSSDDYGMLNFGDVISMLDPNDLSFSMAFMQEVKHHNLSGANQFWDIVSRNRNYLI